MKTILIILLLFALSIPCCAQDIQAPVAPKDALSLMPDLDGDLTNAVWEILASALRQISPDVQEGIKICALVLAATLLLAVVQCFSEHSKWPVQLGFAAAISAMLLGSASTMITLGINTVEQLTDYGKLLMPVMTSAMASQGGVTSASALYFITTLFGGILSTLISSVLSPLLYIYLALSIVGAVMEENIMQRLCDMVKWLMVWGLKTVLYVFTGFMALTGVISGTVDQTAMKATKITISGMVPMVGGILADASEAVLVGAGMVKNSVGLYGLVAFLCIVIVPFLRIGVQYLLLKLTTALSAVFTDGKAQCLLQQFTTAMGFVLAMTGTACLLQMIATIGFMRGVGL